MTANDTRADRSDHAAPLAAESRCSRTRPTGRSGGGGKAHLSLQDSSTFSTAADDVIYSLFHGQCQQNHKQYDENGTGIVNPSMKVDR